MKQQSLDLDSVTPLSTGHVQTHYVDNEGKSRVSGGMIQQAMDAGWKVRSHAAGRVGQVVEVPAEDTVIIHTPRKERAATSYTRGDPVRMMQTAPDTLAIRNMLEE